MFVYNDCARNDLLTEDACGVLVRSNNNGSSLYRVGSGTINPGGLRNKTAESQSAQRITKMSDSCD